MVTRDIDPKELLRGLNPNKWDMVDKKRRDPWLITTKAKLMEDIDVWTALTKGPPTVETLISLLIIIVYSNVPSRLGEGGSNNHRSASL